MTKAILIIGLLVSTFNYKSWSCTCIGEETIRQALKSSDLVIKGKIISKREIKIWSDTTLLPLIDYTVLVSKKYKGQNKSDTVIVRTGFGHGDCGFNFNIGETYLIYAVDVYSVKHSKEPGRSKKELKGIYNTDICTRTNPLNRASEDLLELDR